MSQAWEKKRYVAKDDSNVESGCIAPYINSASRMYGASHIILVAAFDFSDVMYDSAADRMGRESYAACGSEHLVTIYYN